MVDLTCDKDGNVRARLLDLVPGRSGEAYKTWLKARGDTFRKAIAVATLDEYWCLGAPPVLPLSTTCSCACSRR